jgi:ATP synthase protein I
MYPIPMTLPFRKSDASMMRTAWELSSGLLSFVVAIAIGWWVGGVLDRWLSTGPWLTVMFTAFGMIAGVLNVIRAVGAAMRSTGARTTPRQQTGPPAPDDRG